MSRVERRGSVSRVEHGGSVVDGRAPAVRVSPTVSPGDLALARRARADAMDERLRRAFDEAVATCRWGDRFALVAVGGYGRGELSPASDVDVVLVHDSSIAPGEVSRVAEALWYPLWDAAVPLDHAVRDAEQMVATAGADHRAALGMLDARHIAGAGALSARVRSEALRGWRRDASRQVRRLREAAAERAEMAGELAHVAVPDLKECVGGLRDGVVLRGLVATWLVDAPHAEAERHRRTLLDTRDVLQTVSGRRSDRLLPELVPEVAERLGLDPHALTFSVRDAGRRTAHLLDSAWRRLDTVTAVTTRTRRPRTSYRREPDVRPLEPGVGRFGAEVGLTAAARPEDDPLLALRAAAVAAEQRLLLSRASARRLAATAAPLPSPWPQAARRLLVRLLAAGPGLVPVWEELDQVGLVDRWLPEFTQWELAATDVDTDRVGALLRRVLSGSVDLHKRLAGAQGHHGPPPAVELVRDASTSATVLEVRAGDRRGMVCQLCDVFARHRADVRSAHLDTLGPQTHDVFYLTGVGGGPLSAATTAALIGDVRTM